MQLAFRLPISGFRFRLDGFPFAERAALGGHAELCPGAATALAASAGGVQRGGVPLGAGAAGGLTLSEDFGWGGGEAAAGEAARGLHGGSQAVMPFAQFNGQFHEEIGVSHEMITVKL